MSEKPASVGQEVLFEIVDDYVALISLNRPDKRNAVNGAVAEAMDWIVKEVESNDTIRVAILTSSTDGTFSAGADLSEISKGRAHTLGTKDGGFAGFVNAPREKPWIAAVRGSALAGGCELSLTCDMIVASDDSRFGLPEVKRGLFAGAGGVYRLPNRIPRNIAMELIATGDPLPADRAYSLGLVNRLAPLADVVSEARKLAAEIAVNAPLSVRESLKVARMSQDMAEEDILKVSSKASAKVFSSEDAKEGPVAFLEKRAPNWKGR